MLQYVLGTLAKPEVASGAVEFLIRLLVSTEVQKYLRRCLVYAGVLAGALRLRSLRFGRKSRRKPVRKPKPRRRPQKLVARSRRSIFRTAETDHEQRALLDRTIPSINE